MKMVAFLILMLVVAIPAASEETKCGYPIAKGKEVDKRVKILAKPEIELSSEERRKHAGRVIILTAVFCGSGEVTNIKVKMPVGDNVDEKAIAAARRIRFIPGEKDGEKISQFLILEYHVR